jgi:hypothetical protein
MLTILILCITFGSYILKTNEKGWEQRNKKKAVSKVCYTGLIKRNFSKRFCHSGAGP